MIKELISYNINKIDSNLKQLFESVSVKERVITNQFYFEIRCKSNFENLNESLTKCSAECVLLVEKRSIMRDLVQWSYLSNPLNENSFWVDRVSHIDSLHEDVYNLIVKKQMETQYFESLENIEECEPVNESVVVSDVKLGTDELFKEILRNMEINISKSEKSFLEQKSFLELPEEVIKLYHDGYISLSDRFRIETVINNQPGVNIVLFKENYIEVNLTV